MEKHPPIIAHYQLTPDDQFEASRYHLLHTRKLSTHAGIYFLFGGLLIFGNFLLASAATGRKALWPVAIAFILGGVYGLIVHPFAQRWWTHRKFSRRSRTNREITWRFEEDRVSCAAELGEGEFSWKRFGKVVHTPGGLLLYASEQEYYWIPQHGFADESEFERLNELLQPAIERHFEIL